MIRELWIPIPLPNLNDVIETAAQAIKLKDGRVIRGVKWRKMKSHWAQIISLHAENQGFGPINTPAHFELEFREPNRRRDPDNFVGGGMKLIFDAFQEAGLLENDGWDQILSIAPSWKVEKFAPGVLVRVREPRKLSEVVA